LLVLLLLYGTQSSGYALYLELYTPVSLPLAKPASPFAVIWPAGSVGFGRGNQKLLQYLSLSDSYNSPIYTITSSARMSSVEGILMPRVLAVFKLMTSSMSVGNSTGRSPGLAPVKISST